MRGCRRLSREWLDRGEDSKELYGTLEAFSGSFRGTQVRISPGFKRVFAVISESFRGISGGSRGVTRTFRRFWKLSVILQKISSIRPRVIQTLLQIASFTVEYFFLPGVPHAIWVLGSIDWAR